MENHLGSNRKSKMNITSKQFLMPWSENYNGGMQESASFNDCLNLALGVK